MKAGALIATGIVGLALGYKVCKQIMKSIES